MRYDDEIHGRMTNHDGGLKTNWPNLPAARPRKIKEFYAVDVAGETFLTTKILREAQETARSFGGTIRAVRLTEEDHERDRITRQKKLRYGDFSL